MGAIAYSQTLATSPLGYARAKRITVSTLAGAPFDVGANDRVVVVRPDDDERVTTARVCEGIAQCLLTRAGVAWTEPEAATMGRALERRFSRIGQLGF